MPNTPLTPADLDTIEARVNSAPSPIEVTWENHGYAIDEDVRRLVAELRRLRAFVAKQAEDEGLWAEPIMISEAYIQRGLRYLHLVVEGDNFEWNAEGDD